MFQRLAILGVILFSARLLGSALTPVGDDRPETLIRVGFAEQPITPDVNARPVYLAGFGRNRRADAVLDPLSVRAVVVQSGTQTVAIACADVIGLFLPSVERIRGRLPGFSAVIVSATHNHHGPDTMGLWGPGTLKSGVDPEYLRGLERTIAATIRQAAAELRPATARIGRVAAPELLNDTRPPIVKHDELVVLEFRDALADRSLGVVVQWNCHPETLDSHNTRISSDFVGPACAALRGRRQSPVVFLSGSVGGLMTTIRLDVRDTAGRRLAEGSPEKAQRYGELLADAAERALIAAVPVTLAPIRYHSVSLALPVDNPIYLLGRKLGVLDRAMERWTGDPRQPIAPATGADGERAAVRTELGWLRLGEVNVAVIPGEIYPELVLDRVVDPPDPGADFPGAPIEPAIYRALPGPHRMIIGLGNDELGYIIPKRQWDQKPPFTHGLTKAPYGEINSLGPDTAPLLCEAFSRLVQSAKQ